MRREFGDWGMCARRIGADDDAILESLNHDLSALDAAGALALLTAVRDTHTRTLLGAMA